VIPSKDDGWLHVAWMIVTIPCLPMFLLFAATLSEKHSVFTCLKLSYITTYAFILSAGIALVLKVL
jgi:hypothetical protein